MSCKRPRSNSSETSSSKRLKHDDLLTRLTTLIMQKVSKEISIHCSHCSATRDLYGQETLSKDKQNYLQMLGIQMAWCHPNDVLVALKHDDATSLSWFDSLNVMRAAYTYETDKIRYNDCLDDLVDHLYTLYS